MAAATQTRILAGVEDIVALRIRCNACEGETLHQLTQRVRNLPTECPHCTVEFYAPGSPVHLRDEHSTIALLDRLRRKQEKRPLRVILEIDPTT